MIFNCFILSQFKEQEIIRLHGKEVEILDKKYHGQISRVG